jgi:hypothetical protein
MFIIYITIRHCSKEAVIVKHFCIRRNNHSKVIPFAFLIDWQFYNSDNSQYNDLSSLIKSYPSVVGKVSQSRASCFDHMTGATSIMKINLPSFA